MLSVGIKDGRCGVVYCHRGRDAYGGATALSSFRNAVNRCLEVFQHTNSAVFRFMAGCQGCAAGSGVGYAVSGRISRDECGIRKLCKAQRLNAYTAF